MKQLKVASDVLFLLAVVLLVVGLVVGSVPLDVAAGIAFVDSFVLAVVKRRREKAARKPS
jgi:hypothetical protein